MGATRERPRIETGAKRVRAYFGGAVVADTVEPVLVWEVPYYPAYYLPAKDVRTDLLVPAGEGRHSERLGDATSYTLRVGDKEAAGAAVRYLDSPVEELRDLVRLDWNAMDAWFGRTRRSSSTRGVRTHGSTSSPAPGTSGWRSTA
ncbi:MAG: DUF427 domain-containing protein [Actinopolymorphaceae bacterium]